MTAGGFARGRAVFFGLTHLLYHLDGSRNMKNRRWRWVLLLAALLLLLKSVFGTATPWSVGGFFACGACWYWLARRRTRELDAPRPK